MRAARHLPLLLGVGLAALATWWLVTPRELPDWMALRPVERVPLPPQLEGRAAAPRPRGSDRGTGRIVGMVTHAGRPAVAEITCSRVLTPDRDLDAGILGRLLEEPLSESLVAHRTQSDPTGAFVLPGLGQGRWIVVGRDAEGRWARGMVELEREGATAECALALTDAEHGLEGRVRDTQGRPWGARLAVMQPAFFGGAELPVAQAEIDAEGRFRLARLPAGTWFLRITGPGVAVAWAYRIVTPSAGPLDLSVPLPDANAQVTVRASGSKAPVAGAQILAAWTGNYLLVEQALLTDAQGRATLPVVTPCDLLVQAAGFAPHEGALPRNAARTTVALSRLSRVQGRVTSVDGGAPVAGLTVRILRSDEWMSLTDADGRYEIDGVRPGTWSIQAQGPGWASVGLEAATGKGWNPLEIHVLDGVVVTHDIEVAPAARVSGRLLDTDGAPVAGADVELYKTPVDWIACESTVGTDVEGRFAFTGIPPATRVWLRAKAPDGTYVRHDLPALPAAGVSVELRLPPRRWVEVEVRAEGGVLIPSAVIEVERALFPSLEVTTNAEGRARIGPLTDETELRVRASDYATATLPIPDGAELVVTLAPGLPLAGRVVQPDGTPAVGAQVTAYQLGVSNEPEPRTTDDLGEFRWAGLDTGTWTLGAALSYGGRPLVARAEADAGATGVVLQLGASGPASENDERAGKIEVHARDTRGRDVTSMRVAVLRGKSLQKRSVEGARTVVALPDDDDATSFHVVVWDARDEGGALQGPASAGPFGTHVTEVDVTVPTGLQIVGRVEGLPRGLSRGVLIEAHPHVSEWGWIDFLKAPPEGISRLSLPKEGVLSVRTHADGSFALGGLADFPFALVARLPPGWIQVEPVIAEPDDVVTLRVRRGVDALVTVVDEAGAPVPFARVEARHDREGVDEERALQSAHEAGSDERTDQRGEATLRGLRPGTTYTLDVRPGYEADRLRDLFPSRIAPWTPADVRVTLARAYVIEGVVTDLAGRPVPDARVRLRGEKQRDTETADDEGRFRFTKLRRGSHRVWAASSERRLAEDPAPDALSIAAGTRDVVLVVDAATPLVLAFPRGERSVSRAVFVHVAAPDGWEEVFDGLEDVGGSPLTLGGFEAGRRLRVWIPPDDDDPRHALVETSDPASGPLDVVLQRGVSLQLRAAGGNDLPTLSDVTLDSGTGLRFHVHRPRAAAIPSCPPGTWEILARGKDRSKWGATVSVGTADMDVVLAPR